VLQPVAFLHIALGAVVAHLCFSRRRFFALLAVGGDARACCAALTMKIHVCDSTRCAKVARKSSRKRATR
jgi:hypothetical protein